MTFPEPNSWIDVSISVVNHNTNSMNDPMKIAPGIRNRRAARMRMRRRKTIVREAVTIAKVNNLWLVSKQFKFANGPD